MIALRRGLASEKVRYLIGGGWNTVFGYAVFAALYTAIGDEVHYVVLLLIAQVIATANAFLTYRFFVFRVRGSVAADLARFSGVYVVLFLGNLAALPLLVDVVGMPVLVAQALILILTIIGSYLAHKHVSFRR